VGLGFQTGAAPTTTLSIPPAAVNVGLTVKTFQLLYSIAYTF
jgi:hypothetical protein